MKGTTTQQDGITNVAHTTEYGTTSEAVSLQAAKGSKVRRLYRIKRDMSDTIELISSEDCNEPKDIPVGKVLSAILHKLITQNEGGDVIHESDE
jgi:hypothetical protein